MRAAGAGDGTDAPRTRTPLVGLLTANAISLLGNGLTALAVPWFVLETTGSASRTGLVAFASMLPTVLGSLLGGTAVDRLGHKRTSVVSDLASGITVALIPLLHATTGLAFWQLLLLVFLGALLDMPGHTARTAMMPHLANGAGMPLERVNAAVQGIQSIALLLGPPIAGGLIALLGPSDVLWLDAASFAISAALVTLLVPARAMPPAEMASKEGYLAEVTAGVRFIFREPVLRGIVAPSMMINFLAAPLFPVILPVFAERAYGEALDLGLMVAGFGGGMAAGSVAYGALGPRWPKRWTLIVSTFLAALPFLALATTPPLLIAVALMAVTGLVIAPTNPLTMTTIQRRTPEGLRGRVIGAVMASAMLLSPLGMLAAGVALEWISAGATLVLVGVGFLVMAAMIVRNPAFADLDRPEPA